MPRGEKPNPSGPFISINTWAFALHSPHSANISSQPNGKPLLNAQYRADCSSQLIACVFQAGVRNGAVKQLRASPRERNSPRGAAQAGARRQQQCRRRHARLLPGARPHLSAASLPGSPSNCADCQAGQAQAQHSLSSECSSPSPSTLWISPGTVCQTLEMCVCSARLCKRLALSPQDQSGLVGPPTH